MPCIFVEFTTFAMEATGKRFRQLSRTCYDIHVTVEKKGPSEEGPLVVFRPFYAVFQQSGQFI